jgi:hypothetical protein
VVATDVIDRAESQVRVRLGKAQSEHMFSGLPPKADSLHRSTIREHRAPLVGQQVFANSKPSCASSRFSIATSFPEALKLGPSHFAGQAAWKFHRIVSAPVSSRRMTEPFFHPTWPPMPRLYHCRRRAAPGMKHQTRLGPASCKLRPCPLSAFRHARYHGSFAAPRCT